MEKVKFNQMKDGTKEEYLFLDKHEKKYIEAFKINNWIGITTLISFAIEIIFLS